MTDSAEHPKPHADEGAVTQPAPEAASDISDPNAADFLSKEATITTVVDDTAEGDTHVKNTIAVTETDLNAIAHTDTDNDPLSCPVGEASDEDELTIEDLLRQAGWESRGPENKPIVTAAPKVKRNTGPPPRPPTNNTTRGANPPPPAAPAQRVTGTRGQ